VLLLWSDKDSDNCLLAVSESSVSAVGQLMERFTYLGRFAGCSLKVWLPPCGRLDALSLDMAIFACEDNSVVSKICCVQYEICCADGFKSRRVWQGGPVLCMRSRPVVKVKSSQVRPIDL
jgi:hypothetical protein